MLCFLGLTATTTFAQGAALPAPLPAPPQVAASYSSQELDRVVSPIALYPDPLLAQVLSASTFSPDIPAAAQWADQHHYLSSAQLPAAMSTDQLPWQPSVQALLPFPQVLDMMASSMPWTEELGAAFLVSPTQVMDAVQRQRQAAYSYGYLRSNAQIAVSAGPYIEITPVNPAIIVVPYYDPSIVFVAPRPRFAVSTAIRFGVGINLGVGFAPWGWGTTRFGWGQHVMYVNNAPWQRTWTNRTSYVHPYTAMPRYNVSSPRVADQHMLSPRSPRERAADSSGQRRKEEHRAPAPSKPAQNKKGRGGR
ncbi:MAG: DUF3300 domain-containing protein [Acidobacteriaceae bacterium]|jgi:hypothetical protein|nr:DUF3300 domain-containing protein [Acidobacteriaceae bacterium]